MCCNPPLVRDTPLGAPAFVKPFYCDYVELKSNKKTLLGNIVCRESAFTRLKFYEGTVYISFPFSDFAVTFFSGTGQ